MQQGSLPLEGPIWPLRVTASLAEALYQLPARARLYTNPL